MFSNDKISNSQIKKLLVLDIISLSIIIIPFIATSGAQRDGLIAIACGSLAAVVYGLFFLYVSGKINAEYLTVSITSAGKFLTFIFSALYIIKIIFSCWFILMLFADIINSALLPDTNIKIIVFFLIFVSACAAAGGIEVRARIAEVLFLLVLVPLLLLFVFGFKNIKLTNILPLFTAGTSEVWYTGYAVMLTYSAVEFLMFASPQFRSKAKGDRRGAVVQAICIAAVVNVLLFILALGMLGADGAGRQFKASIMIMQLIQIPGGFVQRQDAVMLTIWMLGIFTLLSACFYYLSKITDALIGISNKNLYMLFYGIILFLLCFVNIPVEKLFHLYGRYMAYIALPQSILIPLLVITTLKIRSAKGDAHEEKRAD